MACQCPYCSHPAPSTVNHVRCSGAYHAGECGQSLLLIAVFVGGQRPEGQAGGHGKHLEGNSGLSNRHFSVRCSSWGREGRGPAARVGLVGLLARTGRLQGGRQAVTTPEVGLQVLQAACQRPTNQACSVQRGTHSMRVLDAQVPQARHRLLLFMCSSAAGSWRQACQCMLQ